jgi:DNA-binding NarL/FixJ family response regulator
MEAPVKYLTVLLNGEHVLLRTFLRAWLTRFNRMRVVAEASDGKQTMDLVRKYKPSLVLMDFDALHGNSLEILTRLRLGHPAIKVIIYFASSDDHSAIKLIRAGASGFVVKSAESEDMETAIRTVISGGVYLSPVFLRSFGTAVLRGKASDQDGMLPGSRQTEILRLVALGLTAKAVAGRLKISAKTVDAHKQALMKRIGIKGTTGLVKYAIRSGLVPA